MPDKGPDGNAATKSEPGEHVVSSERRSTSVGLAAVGGVVALLFVVWPNLLAELAARTLPLRAEIRSKGTNFGPFSEIAPTIILRTGWRLAAVAILLLVLDRYWRPRVVSQRTRLFSWALVLVASGCWFGWLSRPFNGFPSNARFHWVDFTTWNSDKYFYAAGKLPHTIFYDWPYIWQALNAMLLVALLGSVAWRLKMSFGPSVLLLAAPALSSNLLMFADSSEDVLLNVTLLVAVVAASLYRRPVLLGLALALAVLGRPSFIVLIPCVAGAEYLVGLRATRRLIESIRRLDWRYAVIATSTAILATAAAQLLFTVLGCRYMLIGGHIIDTDGLAALTATEVDGFEIYVFSGVFTLHVLWMMPLVLLVGSVAALRSAPSYAKSEEASVYFMALGAVAILAVHESQPLSYYNVRYISYLWPLLLVLSWLAFSRGRWRSGSAVRVAVAVALTLGLTVLPVDPIAVKRRVEGRAETELIDVAEQVRDVSSGKQVVVTFGNKSTRNYLAYILKTYWAGVKIVDSSEIEDEFVVVTTREQPVRGRTPAIETDSLLIYDSLASAGTD